jgi:hypothetical protein
VCWLDSGSLDTPHRIGSPAFGEHHFVCGFYFPPEIGATLMPSQWKRMELCAGVLRFCPTGGGPQLKYEDGRLLVWSGGWGRKNTLSEYLRINNATWGHRCPTPVL